ncbi:MAG: hypothetical protein ACW99A_01580 [Candidatus Kariarchaeaceae archaeon]
MENRKKYQNLPKQHVCRNCGEKINAPMHCGHPMHIVETNGQLEWNCWMGANCGVSPLEGKCNSPSLTPV